MQRQLPNESVPTAKEEADKTIKQSRAVLEEMYERQSILDSTKTQVKIFSHFKLKKTRYFLQIYKYFKSLSRFLLSVKCTL